jgi:putative molybdopterin biosynthesis protein
MSRTKNVGSGAGSDTTAAPVFGPTRAAAGQVRLSFRFDSAVQHGGEIENVLFSVLAAVLDHGSIGRAAKTLGLSYRHVWGELKRWEQTLGEPLIVWAQGQRARPTPFAERLVWTERRARARMQPHIEALRADLGRVLSDARDQRLQLLTVCASHDIALQLLQRHAAAVADLHLDIRFQGSADSLRALNSRRCLVAGFHVPVLTGAAPVFANALKPLLKPGLHKLIGCSRRTQGLMVRREHAAAIASFADLRDGGLRFVNRQPGSGTRLLVDHLMHQHRFEPADIAGFDDRPEDTHVAVAAAVASGLADAGAGIEAAALEFGLHFVPLIEEDYFLACLKPNLAHPAVVNLCALLADPGWSDLLARLPGYAPASAPGEVLMMTKALPWWRFRGDKRARIGATSRPASA